MLCHSADCRFNECCGATVSPDVYDIDLSDLPIVWPNLKPDPDLTRVVQPGVNPLKLFKAVADDHQE
jgi:hypothetical protein